ncbi:MAG: hypothetical protein IPH53_15565 [Flavobacteriales bacterium]|nr:hypothetical protein [Flavobacteriales bacterium]
MMHRSFSALLMLTAFAPTQAQTVQKCCGSSNSTFLLGNLATANHSQCLYLPTDLTGATDGEINTRISSTAMVPRDKRAAIPSRISWSA